jgi:hypothetical protein
LASPASMRSAEWPCHVCFIGIVSGNESLYFKCRYEISPLSADRSCLSWVRPRRKQSVAEGLWGMNTKHRVDHGVRPSSSSGSLNKVRNDGPIRSLRQHKDCRLKKRGGRWWRRAQLLRLRPFERSRALAVALETAADANSVSMIEAKTGIDSVGALKAVGETSGRQRFRIEPATQYRNAPATPRTAIAPASLPKRLVAATLTLVFKVVLLHGPINSKKYGKWNRTLTTAFSFTSPTATPYGLRSLFATVHQ